MNKELIIPIYDCLVSIQITNNLDESIKYLDEKFGIIEEDLPNFRGVTLLRYSTKAERTVFIMIIEYNKDKPKYYNTITHELLHLTHDILESRGIYFKKKDANESYAYLQGYLFEENFELFEQAYNKFKKIKTK